MSEIVLSVLSDFSEYPGIRYITQGSNTGEEFYHSKLNEAFAKAYQDGTKLIVNLDGTAGYTSSFIDESFGNLLFDFSEDIVTKILEIISNDEPDWKRFIYEETFKNWSKRIKNDEQPRITQKHPGWYRWVNGKLEKKVWIDKISKI